LTQAKLLNAANAIEREVARSYTGNARRNCIKPFRK